MPFRKILETMGATVDWDDETKTVTCGKGSTEIKLKICEAVAYVNQKPVNLDVAAEIIDGRTFVPLRFIGESLDCKVDWDRQTATVLITTAPGSNQKIGRFGAKFEPTDPNAIYSGAAMADYLPTISMSKTGDPNRKPFLSQMYEELSVSKVRMTGNTLNVQNAFPGTKIILGLVLPKNDSDELVKVYDGSYDDAIQKYAADCKNLGNDIFLRIGFECDGKWKGYDSEKYIKAYRYIVDIFRSDKVDNIAYVWCIAGPTGTKKATMFNWYPGDAYVDWFGFDPYGKGDFVPGSNSDWDPAWFKAQADAHSKPIMICENSRSNTTVTLEQYFNNLFPNLRNPEYGIRGFVYGNHDSTLRPKWTNWGNSIYTDDPNLVSMYNTEMQNPIYLHRDSSYYDPIALFVQASRKGKELAGTPYDKSLDGYRCATGYDYTVTSADVTQNSSSGWAWNPIWQSASDLITIDLSVPADSSGYVLLKLPSDGKMDIKLGAGENKRTVAQGIKPLNNQSFMKYKYEPSDIANGKVVLTLKSTKNLRVSVVGIQTISETAPAAPEDIKATKKTDAISLSWNAVSGAMRYNIYRDGELVGTSITTSFDDANPPAGYHSYSVSASSLKQGEGNMSSFEDVTVAVG